MSLLKHCRIHQFAGVHRFVALFLSEQALQWPCAVGELLEAGSPEEVEIRATALHAVESMVVALDADGTCLPARELDTRLWNRGQLRASKAQPRHRARCVYY